MKKITEKVTTEVVKYQATDGTIFNEDAECRKYENSAKGVLKGKFNKLIVSQHNMWDLMRGNEDNDAVILKLKSKEDANTVLQLYYLENSYILDDEHNYAEIRKKFEDMVERALQKDNYLIMGLNYENEIYFVDDMNTLIDRLKQAVANE